MLVERPNRNAELKQNFTVIPSNPESPTKFSRIRWARFRYRYRQDDADVIELVALATSKGVVLAFKSICGEFAIR